MMGRLKSLIHEFLDIVKNDEEYSHKDWDWENLPDMVTIIAVVERHEYKERSNNAGHTD